jgi:hypothetical protein
MVAGWAGRIEKIGALAFCAAVAASPIGLKIPLGVAAVSPCDMLAAAGAVLFLPSFVLSLPDCGRASWRVMCPVLPLMCVAAISALSGGNVLGGAREVAQLGLYALCGVWICARVVGQPGGAARLGAAAGLGFIVAVGAVVLHIGRVWESSPAVAFMPAIFGGVCLALMPGVQRKSGLVLLAASAVLAILSLNSAGKGGGPAPVPQLRSAVGQRWLEAYAGVSVVSRFPLLGLGPGNYQAHIGEYYGALPKDNTMAADSQVGYAVVVASMGLLGLAGLVYWLARVGVWAVESRPPAYAVGGALMVVVAAGMFTPLFVSPILAPLALVHGAAWGRRVGHV